MMVSFTDHYNAISIDRLSWKTKIGKDPWKRLMKVVLLCKTKFSSARKTSVFIKNKKKTSDWGEYTKHSFIENANILSKGSTTQEYITISFWWRNTKSSFKENARTFSNSSITLENIRILKSKERLWNLYKKKTSNEKSNHD